MRPTRPTVRHPQEDVAQNARLALSRAGLGATACLLKGLSGDFSFESIGEKQLQYNWHRFDKRTLVIEKDEERDKLLELVYKTKSTQKLGRAVAQTLDWRYNVRHGRDAADKLKLAWIRLCNGVREQLVEQAARAKLGWGRDPGTGLHVQQRGRHVVHLDLDPATVYDDDDEDEMLWNKPDVTIWSACPPSKFPQTKAQVADPAPAWGQLCSVWVIRLQWERDDYNGVIELAMGYARLIAQSHPISARIHVGTLCGGLVRLWQFDATGHSCTRPYDFHEPSHRLGILKIIALMTAAKPSCLLQQWQPILPQAVPSSAPDSFLVEGGVRGASTRWQWEAPPELLFIRPDLLGTRTTIWRGVAKANVLPGSQVQDQAYKADESLQGSTATPEQGVRNLTLDSIPDKQDTIAPSDVGAGVQTAPVHQEQDDRPGQPSEHTMNTLSSRLPSSRRI